VAVSFGFLPSIDGSTPSIKTARRICRWNEHHAANSCANPAGRTGFRLGRHAHAICALMGDEANLWIAHGCVGGPASIIAGNVMIERAHLAERRPCNSERPQIVAGARRVEGWGAPSQVNCRRAQHDKSRRCAKPAALTIVIELKRSDGASCFGQTVANLPHFAINLPQKVSGMAL
jgi:hypothetical protein